MTINVTFVNDDDFTPTLGITGTITGRTFRVISPTMDGAFTVDGALVISIPRPRPLTPLAGQFTVGGDLNAGVSAPASAFKDFSHYPYQGVDPAMAWTGINSGALTSAAAGSYARQYAAFTGPNDYPVSGGGYAWKRAAYASVGFKFASMTANQHQILDAIQFEPLPLSAAAPSAYENAREIQTIVKPTRLNYANNPNMESGITGYYPVASATLDLDTSFFWKGSQSLKVTVPAGAPADSGSNFRVSGLIPGRTYTMSAKVAIALGCGDIAPWSGTQTTQVSSVKWTQAADTLDASNKRWRTLSVVFTAAQSEVYLGLSVIHGTMAPSTASIFWVDGVLVEEGQAVREYFDGNQGDDYLWETDGVANLTRSYYYENRVERSFLVQTLLNENTPLGITANAPQYAVLPEVTLAKGLTYQSLANPNRLVVNDASGQLASLTVGSKTVTMRGLPRTFTEQKRTFVDDFNRTYSNGFGMSPAGGTWLNLTGTNANFSVNGSQGVILLDTANVGRYCSLNDGDISDFSAAAALTFDKVPTGASVSAGMTFGYTDSSNHYRARLTVTTTGDIQFSLEKVVGGSTTTLGTTTTVGTGFAANQLWHMRTSRSGGNIMCRAWKDGTSEPGTWTFSVADATYPTGRIGLRGFPFTGNTALPIHVLVEQVALDSGVWAHPPSVTHSTWVRTLDAPFDGSWTSDLAMQIASWSTDTSDDALAYAMKFITGAASGTGSDGRAVGQAQYGPLATDGTRIEFSDWSDYLGLSWTYADGETQNFPHGSITISGCMDCSGFVRTVYGRFLGLPMTFDQSFDGLNIPRRSRDIGPSGPGILVASGTSSAPSLTALQVGDIVSFDADSGEAVSGQLDHTGIYLGTDSGGNPRFISSRKTANGPTMSDLGGNSTLNGTGTYATTLRTIRRF
jgi:cell wall-associated NlpC family hydrolase